MKNLLHTATEKLIHTYFQAFNARCFFQLSPEETYTHNWHIDAISEYLKACTDGNLQRLIINLPPRSLKSITASVAWPAWLLGHGSHQKIICTSYSQNLADKLSNDTRQIMTSGWYQSLFPETTIIKNQNSKQKFQTTNNGFRLATSVGASLIGEGADYIIVDDPQNYRQSQSKLGREKVIEWFEGSLISRLNNKSKGVAVIVMQRLHENDLTGHLIATNKKWEHLKLPAIAESKTYLSFKKFAYERMEGEPLNPVRESVDALNELKTEIGSFAFEAQYQQNPIPKEGGLIKPGWFGRYKSYPAESTIVQSWDTGVKLTEHADPSCCTTWAIGSDAYYLLDVFKEKMEYPDLKRMATLLANQWKPANILIEDKSSGQSLLQDLKRETRLPILPIKPKADKISRLSTTLGVLESGRIKLPEFADWLADFIKESLTFPNSRHDDQIDSMSQFLNWVREKNLNDFNIRRV